MHETAIATNIINEAKKHGEVEEIFLDLGELGHVPPHELLECLKQLVPWKIHAKEIKAKVECSCGFKGKPRILERGHDSFLIECPKCKGMPKITAGTSMVLVKVIVAD